MNEVKRIPIYKTTGAYYFKAYHKPSGKYLEKKVNYTSRAYTSQQGSQWSNIHQLMRILQSGKFKYVVGPLEIRFEEEDWEIREYKVTLHKTINL